MLINRKHAVGVLGLALVLGAIMVMGGCDLFSDGPNTPSGPSIPNAPTGVSATALSSSSISVSWSSIGNATSYDVYYEIGSSTTKNYAGNTSGTSYTHTGLQASTTYWYYIKAKNSAGESSYSSSSAYATTNSGSVTPTPTVPSAPTGVTARVSSVSSVTVSWSAVSGATEYRIYRSTSESGTYTQVGTSTTTSYLNTGLSEHTIYYYKVSARNSAGESPQSSGTVYTTTPYAWWTFDLVLNDEMRYFYLGAGDECAFTLSGLTAGTYYISWIDADNEDAGSYEHSTYADVKVGVERGNGTTVVAMSDDGNDGLNRHKFQFTAGMGTLYLWVEGVNASTKGIFAIKFSN